LIKSKPPSLNLLDLVTTLLSSNTSNKQTMLDLDNPRRFIFSKWTLREGWDNPNVFQ
jgi:restriction endonuclease